MQAELARIDDGVQAIDGGVEFFGRRLALAHYSVKHIDWLAGQAYALERAVNGFVRPEVTGFFTALRNVLQPQFQPAEAGSRLAS